MNVVERGGVNVAWLGRFDAKSESDAKTSVVAAVDSKSCHTRRRLTAAFTVCAPRNHDTLSLYSNDVLRCDVSALSPGTTLTPVIVVCGIGAGDCGSSSPSRPAKRLIPNFTSFIRFDRKTRTYEAITLCVRIGTYCCCPDKAAANTTYCGPLTSESWTLYREKKPSRSDSFASMRAD